MFDLSADELLAGESQYVEYKRERPENAKSYLKTVVAFANAEGGVLVFGVDDTSRDVEGIPAERVIDDMDAIANAIDDSIEPQVIPEITTLNVSGKSLILVQVRPGWRCPYFLKSEGMEGGVYVRMGATTRHADREWAIELTQECAPGGYDRQVRRGSFVTEGQIEALCVRMYEVARSRATEERRETIRPVGKDQLLSWGILRERNDEILPTNAFLVLSGDRDAIRPLQCAIFKDESRAVFLDRRDMEGDVMAQIEGAYQYVLEKMNLGADLGGPVRRDVYELPPWSVREIITNAVLHRSYVQRSATQVALYSDRLEVGSPGGIVRCFSLARVLSGESRPRNEALARAFFYMGLIEGWGSGILRVRREFAERGLREPEFTNKEGFLRVNLYRPTAEQFSAYLHWGARTGQSDVANDDEQNIKPNNTIKSNIKANNNGEANIKLSDGEEVNSAVPSSMVLEPLTEAETRILELIQGDAGITQVELARRVGRSREAVAHHVTALVRKSYIKREGSRKKGSWIVLCASESGGES